MAQVHIVTDSSCDLSEDHLAGMDVTVVPLSVRFGDLEFVDGHDLSVAEFYQRMASTEELPQTACPAPGAFEEAFARAAATGAGAVLCLTLSHGLSETFQSAQTAANVTSLDLPIHVVDSGSVSGGLGTIVLEAARMASEGDGLETIEARVVDLVGRTHVMATLNTLDNLRKGGRIGGARAMLGSILSIKPVVDVTGGTVKEAGRARTRSRARQLLYDRMVEAGPIDHVAVMHGEAPDVSTFLELISPHFPRTSVRVGELGAVVGTHGGAEVLGVSWVAGR